MFHSLENAICGIKGPERYITARRPVSGGDINDAFLLTLDNGEEIFMKANAASMLPAFEAEEQGLLAITQTGTIRTATVLGIGTDPDGFSFLLQEPIYPGQRIREYWEILGEELWAMHAAPVP